MKKIRIESVAILDMEKCSDFTTILFLQYRMSEKIKCKFN